MREFPITSEQIERAMRLYDFDTLNNSIMSGKSNIYGALGEILAFDVFSKFMPVDMKSTYDYDMIFDNRVRVDVKSKRINVRPQESYNCSIAACNTTQKCDMYLFCKIKEDLSVGYIVGYCDKDEYFRRATFGKQGTMDRDTGFFIKADCYNLQIKDLDKINWD